MTARPAERIRAALLAAWPDLGDDPVYLDQLAEVAERAVLPGDMEPGEAGMTSRSTPARRADDTPPPCVCGESLAAHDIRGDDTRGRCSASKGPRAVRCECESYTPASTEQTDFPSAPANPSTPLAGV